MDIQDKRIRLPRIHNFGDDSLPTHPVNIRARSPYDNHEEPSIGEHQRTAQKLQAKYETAKSLKRNVFREDIDTTDWDNGDEGEPEFDEEPQIPRQIQDLKKTSKDNLKAYLNNMNTYSARKGPQNPNAYNKQRNMSDHKEHRTPADLSAFDNIQMQRSVLMMEDKRRANQAYYANKSHIVAHQHDSFGDAEPTIPIKMLQEPLLNEDSFSHKAPPITLSNIEQVDGPTHFENRNPEYRKHDISVLPEIQENDMTTQEFQREQTLIPPRSVPDDSKRYKSAPRPQKNFLIPLAETPAQNEVEPKDPVPKREFPSTQRTVRKPRAREVAPVENLVNIQRKKPGVPRFSHPVEGKKSSSQINGEGEVISKKLAVPSRELSEQKNPSSAVIYYQDRGVREVVRGKAKENRNASVEMGKAKRPTDENYISQKVEYMLLLHGGKEKTEAELKHQNNILVKQIAHYREQLQSLAAKADGSKKRAPIGKLGWVIEELKANKHVIENLESECKKLQSQTDKMSNQEYILSLEKEIQKLREEKRREEREKRNMELLDKKELYNHSTRKKGPDITQKPTEEEIMNNVRHMQEARDRLKRQHNKLSEQNTKAAQIKAEQAETLKDLEEKYSKLLMVSHGYSQGWTPADSAKYEEARKAIERIGELEKKIGILNKATAQQERYQEGIVEVLKKEVECETKSLEQGTKELERKNMWLEYLNGEIQKVVQANPILSEGRGRSCDISGEEHHNLSLELGTPVNRMASVGRGEMSGKNQNGLDVRIAELMRKEIKKLSKQGSSKDMSGSPREEEKKEVDLRPWRHNSKPYDSVPKEVKEEVKKENKEKKRESKVKSKEKKGGEKRAEQDVEKLEEKKEKGERKEEQEVEKQERKKEKEEKKDEVVIRVSSPRMMKRDSLEPDSLEGSPMRKGRGSVMREDDSFEEKKVKGDGEVKGEVKKMEVAGNRDMKMELKKKMEEMWKGEEIEVKEEKKPVKEVEVAKESRIAKEGPLVLEMKETKEEKKPVKEVEVVKESRLAKEGTSVREVKETKEVKEVKEVKEGKEKMEIKPKEVKQVVNKKESKEIEEEIELGEKKEVKKEEKILEERQENKVVKKEVVKEEIKGKEVQEPKVMQRKLTPEVQEEHKRNQRRDDKLQIEEELKENVQDKTELSLKPQFLKGRRGDKASYNPLDLKMKDNDNASSNKPLNIVPESKELVLPTVTSNMLGAATQQQVEKPLISRPVNAPQESKELFMPNMLLNKPKPDADLSLSPSKPDKNNESLELPVTIAGVSRRNRFAQEQKSETKPDTYGFYLSSNTKEKEKDNNEISLDFLKQSAQDKDQLKRDRSKGIEQSGNKTIANNADSSLTLPFKASEENKLGRRRRIGDAPTESESPEKLSMAASPQKEMVKESEVSPFDKPSVPSKGFGLGFGLGGENMSKGVGGLGGNIVNVNPDEEITKGLQARNRLARLRKGDDVQRPSEEVLSLEVKDNEKKGEEKRGFGLGFGKAVDPFAKYDEIKSANIEVKGKDLFGNKEKIEFGKGEVKAKPREDLSSVLDQFNEKTEEITVGNARRMRMNQKDKSVKETTGKEKETVLAAQAQNKQNKFFGDLDMEDF